MTVSECRSRACGPLLNCDAVTDEAIAEDEPAAPLVVSTPKKGEPEPREPGSDEEEEKMTTPAPTPKKRKAKSPAAAAAAAENGEVTQASKRRKVAPKRGKKQAKPEVDEEAEDEEQGL